MRARAPVPVRSQRITKRPTCLCYLRSPAPATPPGPHRRPAGPGAHPPHPSNPVSHHPKLTIPPAPLTPALQHLRRTLDRTDARLGLVHKFLWDRYRSVRQDLYIQGMQVLLRVLQRAEGTRELWRFPVVWRPRSRQEGKGKSEEAGLEWG